MRKGNITYLYERINWAITYLVKAGILERTGRSKFKITDLGIKELENLPNKIDYKYLEKYLNYLDFKSKKDKIKTESIEKYEESFLTPEENIEQLYNKIEEILANDLLKKL